MLSAPILCVCLRRTNKWPTAANCDRSSAKIITIEQTSRVRVAGWAARDADGSVRLRMHGRFDSLVGARSAAEPGRADQSERPPIIWPQTRASSERPDQLRLRLPLQLISPPPRRYLPSFSAY